MKEVANQLTETAKTLQAIRNNLSNPDRVNRLIDDLLSLARDLLRNSEAKRNR